MFTLLVAASDAHANVKAQADYICDGTDDQAEIEAAIAALPSSKGLVQLSEGIFNLSAALTDLEDLGQVGISLAGANMLGTILRYTGGSEIDHFISLKGTSFFQMRDLSISGQDNAKYGLYCARTGGATAGKHSFYNVRVVECSVASHLNYSSEDNTYIKCIFQRSPIGAIFTGYPVYDDDNAPVSTPSAWAGSTAYSLGDQVIPTSANEYYYECTVAGTSDSGEPSWPTTPGNTVVDNTVTWTCRADPRTPNIMPVNYGATWESSMAHYLYGCAVGSDHGTTYTSTRCGLMVCGANVIMHGGVLQTDEPAEAYAIIDQTRRQCDFYGVVLDAGMADIGYRIGFYTRGQADKNAFQNRVMLSGGHLTINSSTAVSYIDAYNLKASVMENLYFVGGPAGTEGIRLLDSDCKGNAFIGCIRHDNTDIPIDDSAADPSNVRISRGVLEFMAGSGATDPGISYNSSLPNRLYVSGGLFLTPGASTNPLAFRIPGESADRFQLTYSGVLTWGDGTNTVDTVLSRAAANVLRTDDQFIAAGGAATKTKSGVPDDSDLASPIDGAMIVDESNNRLYVRANATWKYVALT